MKVILTGDFSFGFKDVFGFLDENFGVQISPYNVESVSMISKVVNPSLFVVCLTDVEPDAGKVFDFLSDRYPRIHVIVIISKENYPLISDKCMGERYHVLFRPMTNIQLLEICRNIIFDNPLEKSDEEEPIVQSAPKTVKPNVMVVDDNGMMLRNIKSMLSDKYVLQLAKSGEQALTMIERKRPDLILLDYNMQGMDGLETFDRILKMEGDPIPVIFLTGVSEKEKIIPAIVKNPAGYILKPPAKDQLVKAIDAALHGLPVDEE